MSLTPSGSLKRRPVSTSHRRTIPSSPPAAMRPPSRENATAVTVLWRPSRRRIIRPDFGSERITVLSRAPVATTRLPGSKATQVIPSVWERIWESGAPLRVS